MKSNITYDNISTFTNCNEIKRLASEINVTDVLQPDYVVCGKLIEIISRAKCLKEFELLPDGDLLFNKLSRAEIPEGVVQGRVKT